MLITQLQENGKFLGYFVMLKVARTGDDTVDETT